MIQYFLSNISVALINKADLCFTSHVGTFMFKIFVGIILDKSQFVAIKKFSLLIIISFGTEFIIIFKKTVVEHKFLDLINLYII